MAALLMLGDALSHVWPVFLSIGANTSLVPRHSPFEKDRSSETNGSNWSLWADRFASRMEAASSLPLSEERFANGKPSMADMIILVSLTIDN